MSDTAIADKATDSTGKVTDTATPSKTVQRKISKPRKLTPKQKLFVDKYTDINDKKTFGNGTQSVLQAYNTTDPDTAKVMAHEILTTPNVQSYIEEINAKQGNSIEERSKMLAQVMSGTLVSQVSSAQYDKDGNLISRTIVDKGVPPSQILRAIDLSNKVEGVYNRANVQEHVAKRAYDERMKELREAMHKRLQAHKVSASITSDE